MFDFFLSYSRTTFEQFSKYFINDLMSYGIQLWVDLYDVPLGIDIYRHLDDVLEKTKESLGAIVIIDRYYLSKTWCTLELKYFRDHHINILPILFNFSKDDIPTEFVFLKSLDRVSVESIKAENYEYAINKVLSLFVLSNKNIKGCLLDESAIFKSLITNYKESEYSSSCIISASNVARFIKFLYQKNATEIPKPIYIMLNITEEKLKKYFNNELTNMDLKLIRLTTDVLINCHFHNYEYNQWSLK